MRGLNVKPSRISLVAFLAHAAWAVRIGLEHPGLGYESDRVANWLYFQSLVSGDPWIAVLWYFPVPKILPILVLGPLADGPAEMLLVAGVAGALAASVTWIVASSFGVAAGAATAVLLAFDPRWTELVAIANADLFVAAGVAAAVWAWCAHRERLAVAMVLLATLVKPPAALAAVPLMLEGGRSRRARFGLAGAVALGLVITAAGYALLLGGGIGTAARFHSAYTALRAEGPTVAEVLGRWLVEDLGTELLPWAWPLAALGLVATVRAPQAQPMRQWLAAASAVAAGFALFAAVTETHLFARFLWSLELCALALCAVAAVLAGRAVARLSSTPGVARLAAPVAATALLAVVIGGLARSTAGAGGRYVVLFEHGARTAMPWLRRLASEVSPEDRVMVPLWFQPAAIWTLKRGLPPQAIEAAEVQVATAPRERAAPDWLLLAPAYFENPATAHWTTEASAGGYRGVASSDVPRMTLLRRTADRIARSSPVP